MIHAKENLSQPLGETKINDDQFVKMIGEIKDYAVVLLDSNGMIQNWNQGAEKIYGYKESEIIGKSFKNFYPKEDQSQKLPENLLKQATETNNVTHEGWLAGKDGSQFWAGVTVTALHNEDNEVIGFFKITKDLTAQKMANDKLKLYAEELIRQNEDLAKREDRYHQMIDEVQDYAIILLDAQGTILHWNKGAERIKGYTVSEAIGKNFTIFYTEEDRVKGLPYQLLGIAKEEGRVQHEGWRIRKDKTKFWGMVVITALHNAKNELIGFSKVTKDLTQRKYAEEELVKSKNQLEQRTLELEESEERYHRMIEEVQDYAIILLDKDGKILNWNKGAEKIKGYRSEEIIGQSFALFYPTEDRVKGVPFSLLKEAALTGKATQDGWRLRKDRTRFWGSIVITALHNTKNELIGFSKVTRDLTERKIAEETLKAYTAKLERNNEELEQFAYVASHDLKEPLRKIITFGNLLETYAKDSLDEKSKDYVSRMQNSASRMMSLIEDLLNFSRVNRPTEGFEVVDLNQLLSRVLSDLEVLIHSRNVRLEIQKLPAIEGRKSQLGQLFQNLISNAIKFNDKEQPVISITCNTYTDQVTANKFAKIEIKDNGIGFENLYKQRIFEIFQRLHGKAEYPGTGIGLAICKKIVEAHGGTISAEGNLGDGATFTITFPLHSILE